MDFSGTLAEVSTHVEKTFVESGKLLPYHNLEHTRNVVDSATILTNHYRLNNEDAFVTLCSAWFHDLGVTNGPLEGHELRSAQLAETWLLENQIHAGIIEKIKNCILATRMPQSPSNLPEMILADADLWHLGTDLFTDQQRKLRKELEQINNAEIDTEAWRKNNINMLSGHRYFTEYARYLLQPKKEEHVDRLKSKLEKKQEGEEEKKKKKKVKDDPEKPTRGVETMFRVTIHNHLELSSMADSKANIMISVNSIIVSVVLSVLMRRLEEYPNMILPTIILLSVNIMTIVFSILAVRPKILKNRAAPQEDIGNKKANLLFFGNFSTMSLETYTRRMKEMMMEKDYLYENMINNIYFMGIVLGKKYHWLRMAYNVFMYGFILAVLAFGVAAVI
jgi:predicted metal-dependent HD superfamily phosphohydrolase